VLCEAADRICGTLSDATSRRTLQVKDHGVISPPQQTSRLGCGTNASLAAMSAAGSPVLLHSGDGFLFAHCCDLAFAEADLREEQVDEICRQRLGRRGGLAAVRFRPVLDARPECSFIDVELISEDVTPQVVTVGLTVHRVGNPRSQDPPVMELELIDDMMRASLTPGVPDWLPSLHLAESLMGLAGRCRPARCAHLTSHSRS